MNDDYRPCLNECINIPATEDQPAMLMQATHGNYCRKEHGRITAALKMAPELVEHLVSLFDSKATGSEKVDGTREAPAPGNEQALNDAHETYRRLVYCSRVWADRMGVQAPGPAVRAWRDMAGNIVGLPDRITPSAAHYAVGIMTKWLQLHLDSILYLDHDDVMFFHDDCRDIFRLNARWPREARARYSDMPCPVPGCGKRIAVWPPAAFGDDEQFICDAGHHIPPDRYEFYVRYYAQLQAEKDPVKRHLMRKYGAA